MFRVSKVDSGTMATNESLPQTHPAISHQKSERNPGPFEGLGFRGLEVWGFRVLGFIGFGFRCLFSLHRH